MPDSEECIVKEDEEGPTAFPNHGSFDLPAKKKSRDMIFNCFRKKLKRHKALGNDGGVIKNEVIIYYTTCPYRRIRMEGDTL